MMRPLALGALAGVLLLATPAAQADEGSYAPGSYAPGSYAPWQDPAPASSMSDLLKNLRALIDKGLVKLGNFATSTVLAFS